MHVEARLVARIVATIVNAHRSTKLPVRHSILIYFCLVYGIPDHHTSPHANEYHSRVRLAIT